jgi:hypothetical protein
MRAVKIVRFAVIQAAAVFVLLEVALSFYNPFPFRMRGSHLVLPVHQRYVFRHEDARKLDAVTYHSKNSLGFRGPDPPAGGPRGPAIVTIGGSTTECLFLSDGKTWTDAFAARLADVSPDVWVNNAGFDGQSTFGHLALLRDVVIRLKPSFAVFLVGINDVGLAELNEYDGSMAPSWLPWKQTWNIYDTRLVGHRNWWHDEWTFLTDHSQIFGLIENFRRMRGTKAAQFSHDEWELPGHSVLPLDQATIDLRVAEVRPSLDGYGKRIREIVTLSRTNGIEPVLLTQPLLVGESSDIDPSTGVNLGTLEVRAGNNGVVEWRRVELYNDVTRRIAGELKVTLVDLARQLPKDSRYYYDFMHYTNEGALRVGGLVADTLAPLVKARS